MLRYGWARSGKGQARPRRPEASGDTKAGAVRFEIFSDQICPWCFIGKRRLERALAERPQPDLTVSWRAFQLNPDMPAEAMERSR